MTIIEKAITNGIAGIASMVKDGLLEKQVLINSVDMMCDKHGTEYVAGLMMEMPNYEEIKNLMDEVA